MKRLKFLIALLAAVMATEGMMAVTLPSTSYNPYSSGYDGSATYSGSMPTGVSVTSTPFMQLLSGYEDIYTWAEHCSTEYPGPENQIACQNCVSNDYNECYNACMKAYQEYGDRQPCISWCGTQNYSMQGYCGRSLPLDGGLGIMLILSVIGAAVRPLMCRKLS